MFVVLIKCGMTDTAGDGIGTGDGGTGDDGCVYPGEISVLHG